MYRLYAKLRWVDLGYGFSSGQESQNVEHDFALIQNFGFDTDHGSTRHMVFDGLRNGGDFP